MQRDFALKHLAELQALQGPSFAALVPFERESKPPQFPVDALPQIIARHAIENAENLQVDPAMIALPDIAAVAAAVQGKFSVCPKPGWKPEPLALYLAISARSSERKSACHSVSKSPISAYEAEKNCDLEPLIQDHKDKVAILKHQIKIAQEQEAKGKSTDLGLYRSRLRTLEEAPVQKLRLCMGDATPEALLQAMADNGGHMAVFSDEGGVLVTLSGSRYGNGGPWVDPLLQAYSGYDVQVTRATKPEIVIRHPVLTVCCFCQPKTVSDMLANSEFLDRGLMARFWVALPESRVGTRTYETVPPTEKTETAYKELIYSLLDIVPDQTPRTITFSPEAHELATELHNKIEHDLPDLTPALESWTGKLLGGWARLCGIFHVTKYVHDADVIPVEHSTAAAAWEVARYFQDCAEILYSSAADSPTIEDAKYTWTKIKEAGIAEFNKRDLLRLCRRFKRVDELDTALQELVRRGYIALQGSKCIVNPESWTA